MMEQLIALVNFLACRQCLDEQILRCNKAKSESPCEKLYFESDGMFHFWRVALKWSRRRDGADVRQARCTLVSGCKAAGSYTQDGIFEEHRPHAEKCASFSLEQIRAEYNYLRLVQHLKYHIPEDCEFEKVEIARAALDWFKGIEVGGVHLWPHFYEVNKKDRVPWVDASGKIHYYVLSEAGNKSKVKVEYKDLRAIFDSNPELCRESADNFLKRRTACLARILQRPPAANLDDSDDEDSAIASIAGDDPPDDDDHNGNNGVGIGYVRTESRDSGVSFSESPNPLPSIDTLLKGNVQNVQFPPIPILFNAEQPLIVNDTSQERQNNDALVDNGQFFGSEDLEQIYLFGMDNGERFLVNSLNSHGKQNWCIEYRYNDDGYEPTYFQ